MEEVSDGVSDGGSEGVREGVRECVSVCVCVHAVLLQASTVQPTYTGELAMTSPPVSLDRRCSQWSPPSG